MKYVLLALSWPLAGTLAVIVARTIDNSCPFPEEPPAWIDGPTTMLFLGILLAPMIYAFSQVMHFLRQKV